MNPLRSGNSPDDLLLGVIVAKEMEALDAPYIVVCRTQDGRVEMFRGPYQSGVEALAAALRDEEEERAAGHVDVEYDVAPLLSPIGGRSA